MSRHPGCACAGRASSGANGSSPSTSGTPSVRAACASAGLCPSMRTAPTRSGRSVATRCASASSRAFVEATMRPLGCSMIEDTAGSRDAGDEAGAVASTTRTPTAARSAARKADTGPSPSAVNRIGVSSESAGAPEAAPASSSGSERTREAAHSAAYVTAAFVAGPPAAIVKSVDVTFREGSGTWSSRCRTSRVVSPAKRAVMGTLSHPVAARDGMAMALADRPTNPVAYEQRHSSTPPDRHAPARRAEQLPARGLPSH